MKISVVVCTFNRDRYIEECLSHLNNQTCGKNDYEVIIVNNNSTDNTEEICLNYIRNQQLTNFFYFIETSQGLSHARNRGIKESKGEIVCFIDDDAFTSQDYITNAIKYFSTYPQASAAGGKVIPVFEEGKPPYMSSYLLPLVAAIDLGDEVIEFPERKFPVGANMLFRREIFVKAGVFDTKLGRTGNNLLGSEEKDIFHRLSKEGFRTMYFPMLKVNHIVPGKRVQPEYIRNQAVGIGVSERMRVSKLPFRQRLRKFFEESIKVTGTFVLLIYYLLLFQPSRGIFLVKFRYWVLKGYFQPIKPLSA
jgi:glucosyl-dolichyl phosphate glucuronosyltransferase